MSRRHRAEKRVIIPDVKYGSKLLTKFINNVMEDGKKASAENIVYGAFERIQKKHKKEPFEVFTEAMENVKPSMEVTSVRVGGANYQVPTPVSETRANALCIRWMIAAAKSRSENTMEERLAEEWFDASQSRGASVKKKEDTHKMAEANKAFSHFSPRR